MFNNSKYTRYYYDIIKSAQERSYILGYFEKHHIIPKCMGGSNGKDNLVKLTAREHYLCHLLLIRMVDDIVYYNKMVYAAWCFVSRATPHQQARKIVVRSRMYEHLKIESAKVTSAKFKGRVPWNKGKPTSQEAKDKNSQSNKGKIPWNKGKEMPQSQKDKLKGREPANKGKTGRTPSLEERAHLSQTTKNFHERLRSDPIRQDEIKQNRINGSIRRKKTIVDGKEYQSITEAMSETGLSYHMITKYHSMPIVIK